MVRSASVSLHASGGRLTPPMLFAHSNSWPLHFWQQCRSPSTYAIKLGIWISALVAARVASCRFPYSPLPPALKRNSKFGLPHRWQGWHGWHRWHCLALLALLAGTPAQQGSIQPNFYSLFQRIACSEYLFLLFNRSLWPTMTTLLAAEGYTGYDCQKNY